MREMEIQEPVKPAQDDKGRFISGNIGGGRPKGARAKLGEAFIKALFEDFNENGVDAIQQVRDEKPDQYLKVIASLMPKEITGEDGGPLIVSRIELVPVTPE